MATIAAAPSAAVRDFLAELARARREVELFSLQGENLPVGDASKRLEEIKTSANGELGSLEQRIVQAAPGPSVDQDATRCIRLAWRCVGRHVELVLRLNTSWFDIEPDTADGGETAISDIKILARGVPVPDGAKALKLEIDTTLTIIKSVMAERMSRLGGYNYAERLREVRSAQTEYMSQLLGIARVGLMTAEPSLLAFARDDLARVRTLFTMREAGKVKNSYVNRLWKWSALAAAVFGGLYFVSRTHAHWLAAAAPGWEPVLYDTRNFHLMAAGTAIGTWLSFSLRRQELAFEDLAVLEPDRLDPPTRVAYMIGLSSFVGLLLFSGAVIAGLGTVTGLDALHQHGSWALLLGLLSGVAERALGTAVRRRGDDFASVIGGTTGSAKVTV